MSPSVSAAILTYHSLDESGSVLSTSPHLFEAQMAMLRELRVRVVSLEELRSAVVAGRAQERLISITFDDGFRNAYQHAFPILRRYGYPATVFLVTDYCGKTNSWPGQPASVDRLPLLGWNEVREMSDAGIEFGSHTVNHPNLTTLSTGRVKEELAASKNKIEDVLGRPARSIAYPYGAYDKRTIRIAAELYEIGCTTVLSYPCAESNALLLERLDAYYLRRPALFRRLFSPETASYIGIRRRLRGFRATALGWLR